MANVSFPPPTHTHTPCTQGGTLPFQKNWVPWRQKAKKKKKKNHIRARSWGSSVVSGSSLGALFAFSLSVAKRGSSEPCCTMSHLAGEPRAQNINLLLKGDVWVGKTRTRAWSPSVTRNDFQNKPELIYTLRFTMSLSRNSKPDVIN